MAQAFEGFAKDRQFQKSLGGIIIVKARDYAPKSGDDDFVSGSDVPWIRRFSKAGGRFIISGDTNMTWEPHERLALIEEGMTVFFFGSQWSEWKFFRKCALLMVWWPVIAQKTKRGHKGKFWRVPTTWAEGGKLQPISTKDRRLVRIERQRSAQKAVSRARKARRHEENVKQGSLQLKEPKP